MENKRPPIRLIRLVIRWMPIIMMVSVTVTHGKETCSKRLDLVIAVDTTSSQSSSSFDAVKAEVKGIVSTFTVDKDNIRLALISMSGTARVVTNFNDVNSLSDFNAAVDSLTFSNDIADLSEAIKVAKESVLSTARTAQVSKVLVLVKDRRSGSAAMSDAPALSRVTSEAAAVKTLGAAINAVGVGGLWSIAELRALFGPDYLLFLNKNKALESVKSLNYQVCVVLCPDNGKSFEKAGLCHKSERHVLKSAVLLRKLSSGSTVCNKEMTREFTSCSASETCTSVDRKISACNSAGKVTVENTWQSFSSKLQSCVTTTDVQTVDCKDALKCVGQKADVVFLLDTSRSIGKEFPKVKTATRLLIQALNVGRESVRVSLIPFSKYAFFHHRLKDTESMAAVLHSVENVPFAASGTFTDRALQAAHQEFVQQGRRDVRKFLFIITDGESYNSERTMDATARVKNDGATFYGIGVGKANSGQGRSELRMMTAPDSDTNTIYLDDFNKLTAWAQKFSKRLCAELSAPHPKLCDDQVFRIAISECFYRSQQVTKTEYVYDASKKCVKTIQSTVHRSCRKSCTDPIDGNEHFLGAKWSTLCHEFECIRGAKPLLPKKTSCFAADGSCKAVGSPPFACRDEAGVQRSNCQCVLRNGKVTTVMELVVPD